MNIHVVNQFIPEEHDLNNKKILIIGSRASGKSFLIKDLLFNIPHISSCNHYSFQKDYNSYYGNFINNYLLNNELTYETFRNMNNEYTKNYSTFVIKFYANKPQFYHYTAKEHKGFVGYGIIYKNILE